ncbi:hypothetical protein DEO72_LG8g1826 [Vigna unguiculata]|uniref:Uncharacterized protein n=1 Tax=Vigna unguiculata TaxID=3917 RepID=A0A4D6MUK1_VIGUN|nr:hypothetical protein DEO72_LG8g1826 [Vigna unguiculata]
MLVVVNDGCSCHFPATKARWWRFVDPTVQVLLLTVAASMDDGGEKMVVRCHFPATKARWWRFVDPTVQVLLLTVAASMDDGGEKMVVR